MIECEYAGSRMTDTTDLDRTLREARKRALCEMREAVVGEDPLTGKSYTAEETLRIIGLTRCARDVMFGQMAIAFETEILTAYRSVFMPLEIGRKRRFPRLFETVDRFEFALFLSSVLATLLFLGVLWSRGMLP